MKIRDIRPDTKNANKGTAKGQKLIVSSIQHNGFGRSGLLDKDNNVIAGNKTTEAAAEVFGVEVQPIIVETDGTRPVYVKRIDLDLNDPDPNNPARQLAYMDNLSQHFSFALDAAVLQADIEAGLNLEAMDLSLPDLSGLLEAAALDLLGGNWEDALNRLPDSDRAPFQQMTFTLHDSQVETIKKALSAAQRGNDFNGSQNENSNGNALAFICESFINGNG